MKKPPKMFTVEVHPPGRPGKACIGVECGQVLSINLIPNRTGKEPMTYSAPIEKVYATLQRWHVKEHPTGRKRGRKLFGISEEEYRLEKDMILTAKFAIQRGGISSPVFVTLAQNAFKIARHAKSTPDRQAASQGLFTSSEQMRKYRMEHQGGL